MAARDDHAPTFGQQPVSPFVRLFAHRWVRWAAVAFVLVVVALTAWYQLAVAPHLTSTQYRVYVAGSDDRLIVKVDDEGERAIISGGNGPLTGLIIDGDSLFVLADEVGAEGLGVTWLEVPVDALDPRWAIPTPDQIGRAISRDVKDCGAPSSDAAFVFGLLLGIDTTANGGQLCGSAMDALATDGTDLIVLTDGVRPSALGEIPPTSVGQLADLDDRETVMTVLNRLIRCEGRHAAGVVC